ncbi:MAG TPA: phosphoglycerate kinase [Acidobacteriota bacterium]|nr:phosphoglycerate kinase [Acidobacteriota bacterium]
MPGEKLSIRDLDLDGKWVFVRVDFNVPVSEGGVVDDTRIRAALPSIQMVCERGGRAVLASHLGRPKGKPAPEYSLRPAAERLASLLGRDVDFVEDCVGREVEKTVKSLLPGEVLLLENLRFHDGETKNDPRFAAMLAALADEYVNDAFGTAHRAHASTVGVPEALGRGAAGLLIEKELQALERVLRNPSRPLAAILGGAKVSDKIEVIENLLSLADSILLGGGMAFTFLKAEGKATGSSMLEEDRLELASELVRKAQDRGVGLLLPSDVRIAREIKAGTESMVVPVDAIPEGWMGLDIGPRTVEAFQREISAAGTILWNGPLGVFELDDFADGTIEIALAVAASSAYSLIGGGDSVSAVKKAGVTNQISHISTGGGASLEFLAGKKLPGIEALTERMQ